MASAKRPAVKRTRPARPPARRGRVPGPALVILSRNPKLYSTRRLVAAARARDLDPRVLDTLRCDLLLERDRPRLFHRGVEVDPAAVRVVIPRIGASITGYGLSVVNQFDLMGVPVLNGAAAIGRSRDKLRALQLLSSAGLAIPRTALCRYRDEVPAAVGLVGGLPCIIKLVRGAQGVGVMIAGTMAEVTGLLDTLWTLGQEILLQELVKESRGRDVRALVIGDEVVAAMRRTARAGEFRSNIHRGGAATRLDLPGDYARAAIRAARVVGLQVAGVDLLEAHDGPMIMEVNSSPGFEALERSSGIDIATRFVDHAVAFAARTSSHTRARTSSR
jgi:ribosomal protein S6--L-glutamate ligase